MIGQRPEEYTGPWGKKKRVSWTEESKDPYWYGAGGKQITSRGTFTPMRLRPGVTRQGGGYVQQRSGMQTVEDLPWYMKGEGGGMLGRRRAEVEGIDPQEMYGLAAPSVRKTTAGLISGIEEEAARTGRSPAMMALMKKGALSGELEGLGAAAGTAVVGAHGMRERARAGLAGMEAGLGQAEMAGRRGVTRGRIPMQMQTRRFQREDVKQRESQDRLKRFWSSYGM